MQARSPRTSRDIPVAALPVVALAYLAGCALPPAALRGGPFADVQVAQVAQGVVPSEPVRWGGVVADVRPSQERTCFTVVSQPLDDRARPEHTDAPGGRFIACATGFYEPETWAPGRMITVVGWVSGTQPEKVGDYDYEAPVVDAYTVYLWPKRPPYPYGWGWGPYPYWGWGPGVWVYGGPGWYPWGPYPYYYRPWIW